MLHAYTIEAQRGVACGILDCGVVVCACVELVCIHILDLYAARMHKGLASEASVSTYILTSHCLSRYIRHVCMLHAYTRGVL